MIGRVDDVGRAFLPVSLRPFAGGRATTVDAWVDTAFDGDIALNRAQIATLALPLRSGGHARLADGSQIELLIYSAQIDWFGVQRFAEVVATDGLFPLLGVGLLLGHSLHIDYVARTLVLS